MRIPIVHLRQGLLAAGLAGIVAGCGPPPDETLDQAQTALDGGDPEAAQTAFRRGLEHHPEHLELLLFAARFYLSEEPAEHHKPRLALHYATRATRADPDGRVEVAAVHVRALRAMDQGDDARILLDEALARHGEDPELAALREP